MKHFRRILFISFALVALVGAAQQTDPVVLSIRAAYNQAKQAIKQNKSKGNEMVTKSTYTIRGEGKTTETLHFFYTTTQGTFWLNEGDTSDPNFYYYPLNFITRSYNIGKRKYYEEYLYDPESQHVLFILTQDYDAAGNRFDRRYYFSDGAVYTIVGPEPTPQQKAIIGYQADELRHAFDWLMRNPKE